MTIVRDTAFRKYLICAIIVQSFAACIANAELKTITSAQLQGVWLDAWLLRSNDISPEQISTVRNCLRINPDGSSELTRWFSDGGLSTSRLPPESVKMEEDLLILDFDYTEIRIKLVLSGWTTGSTYALFGQMFLLNEEAVFNGIPVAFAAQSEIAQRDDIKLNVFDATGCSVGEEASKESMNLKSSNVGLIERALRDFFQN